MAFKEDIECPEGLPVKPDTTSRAPWQQRLYQWQMGLVSYMVQHVYMTNCILSIIALLWLTFLTIYVTYPTEAQVAVCSCPHLDEVVQMRQDLEVLRTQQADWMNQQRIIHASLTSGQKSHRRLKRDAVTDATSPQDDDNDGPASHNDASTLATPAKPNHEPDSSERLSPEPESPEADSTLAEPQPKPEHTSRDDQSTRATRNVHMGSGVIDEGTQFSTAITEPAAIAEVDVAAFTCLDLGDGMLHVPNDRIYNFWMADGNHRDDPDTSLINHNSLTGRFSPKQDQDGLYMIQLQVMFRTFNRVEVGMRLSEDTKGNLAECRNRIGSDSSSGLQSCYLTQIVELKTSSRLYVMDAFRDSQLPAKPYGTFIKFIRLRRN